MHIVAGTQTLPDDLTGNSSITVAEGTHQFQVSVQLQNNSDVNAAANATLSFNNALKVDGQTFTKTGVGTLATNNKLTTAGDVVDIQQGTVSGIGTINGDVINNGGTISPGDSLGAQSVVPEPAAAVLLGLGLLWGLGLLRSTGERHQSR